MLSLADSDKSRWRDRTASTLKASLSVLVRRTVCESRFGLRDGKKYSRPSYRTTDTPEFKPFTIIIIQLLPYIVILLHTSFYDKGFETSWSFIKIPRPSPRTTPNMKAIPFPSQSEDYGLEPDHSFSAKNQNGDRNTGRRFILELLWGCYKLIKR